MIIIVQLLYILLSQIWDKWRIFDLNCDAIWYPNLILQQKVFSIQI